MVRSSSEAISEDAVRQATGRGSEEWFALLDEAGAAGWGHTAIARWLVDEQEVDAWWAQGLTVRYEQARGLRLPGQQADGSFTASASKTLHGELVEGYRHVVDRFSAELGDAVSSRAEGRRPYARWAAGSGSVLVTVEVAAVGRLRVSAAHERLADPAEVAPAKERLRAVLDALAR